eukprot:6266845-Alexandrium_andersonii.AAC.1
MPPPRSQRQQGARVRRGGPHQGPGRREGGWLGGMRGRQRLLGAPRPATPPARASRHQERPY